MKRISILLAMVVTVVSGYGQLPRIYRTEFVTYDTRESALVADMSNTANRFKYQPKTIDSGNDDEIVGETISFPASWGDYDVYLHIENTHKSYDVVINGYIVAQTDDAHTPADYLISPYMQQGVNDVALRLRESYAPELDDISATARSNRFEGSYIFAQYKLHIFDYYASVDFDESGRNAELSLGVIVNNSFNYSEPIIVGYDIYTPDNKLIDYAVREIVVDGHSRDTLSIHTALGKADGLAWNAASPALYRLMLYVKRDGTPREYIPFKIGIGKSTFDKGRLMRNGLPLKISSAAYNARATQKETMSDIKMLKKQGVNTLIPSTPQPKWFYDLCDSLGVYVIERVNINSEWRGNDRRVGGTPANNPALVDEYIARVKAMYFRTRNNTCVVAYLLGGANAGNGYNMYKAYEWLKTVEHNRAVICETAEGEWNTDIDKIVE